MPDSNSEILEEKIRLLSSDIRDMRSEFKQLRDDGWVLRKNSDTEMENDAKDGFVEIEHSCHKILS